MRQMLVVRLANPCSDVDDVVWMRGAVALRMQLSNGLVYSLQLVGNTGEALGQAQGLATWLQRHPYDEKLFPQYERGLFLELQRNGVSRCTVRLDRNARASAVVGISAKLAGKVAHETINRLRVEQKFSMIEECPAALGALYTHQLSTGHAAIASFFDRLDRDVLVYIRGRSTSDRLAVYNFLAEHGGKVSRSRLQAMQSMPTLLDFLVPSRRREQDLNAVRSIVADIDRQAPMLLSVAQAFDVAPETVRWLRSRALPRRWSLDERRLRVLLNVLSWIAPERRPASDADFEGMMDAVQTLSSALKPFLGRQSVNATLLAPRYSGVLKRWMGQLLRPDCGAAPRKLDHLVARHGSLAGVADFLMSLHRAVFRFSTVEAGRGGDRDIACQDLVLAWVNTRSLRQLLDCSARWHAALHVRATTAQVPQNALSPPAPNRQWPLVLATPIQLGSLTVFELGDELSLLAEGRAMGHCVGTFSAQCMFGDSVIVSVRDAYGGYLSTAELHLDSSTLQVVPGQHCALKNLPPRPDCNEAVDCLVRQINGVAFRDALAVRSEFQQVNYMRRARQRSSERHGQGFEDVAEAEAWTLATGCAPLDHTTELAALAVLMLNRR